jgi:hypothetical protein
MYANQTAARDRVRAPRFKLEQELVVTSKTIGTDVSFRLNTENVSRSGMLLRWGQTRPIPFIENTIIEMTIDPKGELLHRPVICLGKIVRKRGTYAQGDLEFGIAIIQIDNADLDVWESCLEELSSHGIQLMAPDPQVFLHNRVKKAG